jgi:CubicO group peptidase (beta-lactamase class C family)
VVLLVVAGCGVGRTKDSGPSPTDDPSDVLRTTDGTFPAVTLDLVDRRLRDRVTEAGLPGGALIVATRDAKDEVQSFGQGDVDLSTVVPMAETSMLPTTAALLTLVDDGTLGLDEAVGTHLAWMTGPSGAITLRQLLSHTSGLPASVACAEPTPAACDAAIAAAPLVEPPGEGFHVTDLDAHVAARLAEVTTGQPWAQLFHERIAAPAAMTVTSFADPSTTGGLVAVDGTTTPWDLGQLLAVVRDGGRAPTGLRVLSEESVREMLVDQTVRLDTHTEPWVAETGVPTYGLGVWRDRLRGDDVAAVVSAPNRYGLYPFVDVGRSTWGIVVIDDHTSPRAEAVSASATITQLTAAALRNSPD